MAYFVTVIESGDEVVVRKPYVDYSEAINSLSRFYRSRAPRATLEFTTELINGKFARSYLTLMLPEDLDPDTPLYEKRRRQAVKQRSAYEYGHSYFFLIESEVGVADADRETEDDEA